MKKVSQILPSNIELSSFNHTLIQDSPHFPQCFCNKSRKSQSHLLISPDVPDSCYKAKQWCKRSIFPPNPEEVYDKLLSLAKAQPENAQLDLDLPRTFPDVDYFATGTGRAALSRIMHTFSAYSPSLDYVQGMNYIAATLLWHATEEDAFWLFVVLIEDFELRDNFITGFPGLHKHYHAIEFLVYHDLPLLYNHFLNANIAVQMFATEWIMTLFTSVIPLEQSQRVLNKFFKYGWTFMYKLCLEIITRLKGKLLLARNTAEILNILKPDRNSIKQWNSFVKSMKRSRENTSWKKITSGASKLDVHERFLNCMLHNTANTSQNEVQLD